MGIGLLGPLRVDGVGPLEPRDRIALSALAVRRDQAISPEQFADALWGETLPASWPKQVQICVGRLRKVLGPTAIDTVPGGYRLALDADDLDTCRFEQLIERGRSLVASGEVDRAASAYARALSLWRGPPLDELDGWLPGRSEAARLEELRRTAEEDLLDARLAAGEHRQVAAEAQARVAEEPLRERRWATLALAQYRCGRQAAALRSLSSARRVLAEQLGIDPGPDLIELEAAILRQDAALAAVPEPPSVSGDCPYKGLAPYDADDAEAFFGREAEVTALLERLPATPLLVVAGPSGCGKSSLVRAGLVPALRHRGRATAVFVPGSDPEAALADASASVESDAVLVVDQFEELYALGRPRDVVRAFCLRIAEHARDRAPVVIVVRSDHLGGLGTDPAFSRLVEQGLHLVSPLDGDALREAIEQPAALAGLRLEHGLVELLVRDCEGEPGALPMLSHALAETWRRRDGNVLTVEAYRATGGIRGAVARSADRLYDSLAPEQRAMLRSVLLRLVTPSLDGDPVRCRVSSRSLVGDPGRERVVALLVRSRLVTADEYTIEVAHEALARAWPRLRSWLDDDAAGQRILRHLSTAAEGWESLGRPESELYRGGRLDTALEWREAARPELTDVERAFLEASADRAASESRELAERARRDARQNRRLRRLLAAAAVFLVGSLVAGLLAVDGRDDARGQRDAARAAQEDAQLEALVKQSLALRSTNRSVAALLAVEAYRRRPDAHAWSALLGSFSAAPTFLGHRYLPASRLAGATVPGTSTAVVALDFGDLKTLDLASGQLGGEFPPAEIGNGPGSSSAGTLVRVSGDGRYVGHVVETNRPEGCGRFASSPDSDGEGCGAFSVYEIGTGRRVLGPVTPPFQPGDLALNADGSLVAVAGGLAGDLAVYRTDGGEQVGALAGLSDTGGIGQTRDTAAVAFGPDGLVYLGSLAGPIRAVDPSTIEVVREIDAPPLSSNGHLEVTPDGLLVGGGWDALVALDTRTGTTRWTARIGTELDPEPCPWIAVAAEAGTVYCGSFYGVIEERDLATGERTGVTLDPQLGAVGDLVVTPDGRELVAFGDQAPAVSRWRLDGGGLIAEPVARDHVAAGGYDPSGETLLVAPRGPTLGRAPTEFDLWDPEDDERLGSLSDVIGLRWAGHDALSGLSLGDGEVRFFDAASQEVLDGVAIPTPADIMGATRAADLPPWADGRWPSAGGTRMYVGLPTGEVWPVDVESRQRIEPTIQVDGWPWSVSATRDGERVVVTAISPSGNVTTVHDGRTGDRIGDRLVGPAVTSVSLDGVLVGAEGGDITRYDLETLEPVATLPGARGDVSSLQFSSDGRVLLATSSDQTASLYDVATGTRLGDPLPTGAPAIVPGWLRPDGGAVALTTRDGVAIWDIEPAHLAEAACRLAGRNLTETEWETYLADLGDHRASCPEHQDPS